MRRAGSSGMVLLQNRSVAPGVAPVLPIALAGVRRVAVIGPNSRGRSDQGRWQRDGDADGGLAPAWRRSVPDSRRQASRCSTPRDAPRSSGSPTSTPVGTTRCASTSTATPADLDDADAAPMVDRDRGVHAAHVARRPDRSGRRRPDVRGATVDHVHPRRRRGMAVRGRVDHARSSRRRRRGVSPTTPTRRGVVRSSAWVATRFASRSISSPVVRTRWCSSCVTAAPAPACPDLPRCRAPSATG